MNDPNIVHVLGVQHTHSHFLHSEETAVFLSLREVWLKKWHQRKSSNDNPHTMLCTSTFHCTSIYLLRVYGTSAEGL